MTERTHRGLVIVDVQRDFCEGGSLAVAGGEEVARRVTELLRGPGRAAYDLVVASRDWHDPHSTNDGHFDQWPVHCVAETPGAEYHPELDATLIDVHVRKGAGQPAYSAFEGRTTEGDGLADILREAGITDLDIVGIATDHCVRATALDAVAAGFDVAVLSGLHVGVAVETTAAALTELVEAGVAVGAPEGVRHPR